MDLERVERELKKRWAYPYHWGRKQSDYWDKETNFIYQTYSFERLEDRIKSLNKDLSNYALNRWYNFWSAMAVEDIFCSHPQVVANKNEKDKLVDFTISNIPFDHKTSVFPKGFQKNILSAQESPIDLLKWLYKNQSQEGRKHLKNRLFILLYENKKQEHWKLKAEIGFLQKKIDEYVRDFSHEKLHRLDFGQGKIYADIIWLVK